MSPPTFIHLVLIGFRGAGKTAVGRILAERLGWPLVDTDALVEAGAGTSIAEIFAAEGEAGFRRREADAVRTATEGGAAVISAGGGVVLRDANMRHLKGVGAVVWLQAGTATLLARITDDARSPATRPPLTPLNASDEVSALAAKREPLYRRWADLVVVTDGRSPQSVADEITTWWRSLDTSAAL